ncbi:ScyD/ScyE family protein [Amnibacterium endophyticum]|uniref:ScyD/ScyE family protein n=1 Tax=Amnibacterium endophyticum TaxID=2109337 RepID=A0ABW4LE09_9MICO
MRAPLRSVAAALAAVLLVSVGAGTAAADDGRLRVTKTLPGSFVAPLQIAVDGRQVLVADSAASALYRIGSDRPIARGPAPAADPEQSGDLAAVDSARGRIAYTTTEADHRNTYLTVLRHGQRQLRVNLGAYERRVNPDGRTAYGATDPSKVSRACAAELQQSGVPASYTGQRDSHPYAVVGLRDGSWLVADAGGNDLLRVSRTGRISTVAVLPAQPVHLTPALAAELHAPSCAGITYRFESVPTDVEVGPGGIHVTTLPGGAGAPGSVYRIPWGSHRPHLVATGFEGAVNLAVAPSGRIWVVELGQGIDVVTGTGHRRVLDLPGAASVEWSGGRLYASTAPAVLGQQGAGRVVVLR